MRSIPGQGNALETEPSFDDAACCPFESFYRANRNEKQPDYQYHCAYLPVLGICCTFATKRYKASAAYAAVKAALPTKKRQTTPVADCDRYFLRKKGTKLPRHRRGFLATFDTKKYKVPRGRRPRLTADQKAANNISRRLRSVLFATQQHLEIPATGSGARASVSAKSVAIFRPGTRFATFGLVVPGKIVTFESYLFKPIERCSNACSRLRPSSIKRG